MYLVAEPKNKVHVLAKRIPFKGGRRLGFVLNLRGHTERKTWFPIEVYRGTRISSKSIQRPIEELKFVLSPYKGL